MASPASGTGNPAGHAIAIIELHGEIDLACELLGVRSLDPGKVSLRAIPGVDELLIARLSETLAMVFPHGGSAVLRALTDRLNASGIGKIDSTASTTATLHPEACDNAEARMLEALNLALSPIAVDLLLDQPRRWREHDAGRLGRVSGANAAALARLIHGARVVAIGPPNVGKSSLLNALAKRTVAVVADQPGTTRDHVGVTLNLAGFVVHYIDCPGWDADRDARHERSEFRLSADGPHGEYERTIQHAAQRAARIAAQSADLILSCGDPISGFLPESAHSDLVPPAGVLRVLLRADLGPEAQAALARTAPPATDIDGSDCVVSVRRSQGLESLVDGILERLVPSVSRADPGAWAFWTPPGDGHPLPSKG